MAHTHDACLMSALPHSTPAAAALAAPAPPRVIWINGQAWPLMPDNRFPLLHYFAKGTVLLDPHVQPARPVALHSCGSDYGVTRQRLQPNAHYHAFYHGKSPNPPDADHEGGGEHDMRHVREGVSAELVPILAPYTCLYVTSGLPTSMTKQALLDFFARFGEVREGDIFYDAEGRHCRGSGWVIFVHAMTLWLVPRELPYVTGARCGVIYTELSDRTPRELTVASSVLREEANVAATETLPATNVLSCTTHGEAEGLVPTTTAASTNTIETNTMVVSRRDATERVRGTRSCARVAQSHSPSSSCACAAAVSHAPTTPRPSTMHHHMYTMESTSHKRTPVAETALVDEEIMPAVGSLMDSMESNGLSCAALSRTEKDSRATGAAVVGVVAAAAPLLCVPTSCTSPTSTTHTLHAAKNDTVATNHLTCTKPTSRSMHKTRHTSTNTTFTAATAARSQRGKGAWLDHTRRVRSNSFLTRAVSSPTAIDPSPTQRMDQVGQEKAEKTGTTMMRTRWTRRGGDGGGGGGVVQSGAERTTAKRCNER